MPGRLILLAIAVIAVAAGGFILKSLVTGDGPAYAVTVASAQCLACHSQDTSLSLPGGEKLPLKINPDAFAASVHKGLECSDCHRSIKDYPHPGNPAKTIREYKVSQQGICQDCHKAPYNEMKSGVHRIIGDALLCSDCHSPHAMTRSVANSQVAANCDKCHTAVGQAYRSSVHGKSLTAGNNDLPGCTDCHLAHQLKLPPRTESFTLCSNCHANADLMSKYGIVTDVVGTYLEDFHGKTAFLLSRESPAATVDVAICTDCHGDHGIQEKGVSAQGNLLDACRRCHQDAGERFASAWLSHAEPSLKTAPLVFAVQVFYQMMIPFIIFGLLVHVVMDLRRSIRH